MWWVGEDGFLRWIHNFTLTGVPETSIKDLPKKEIITIKGNIFDFL